VKEELKFLGLKMKPVEGGSETKLMSATRKGSNLTFTKGAQFAVYLSAE